MTKNGQNVFGRCLKCSTGATLSVECKKVEKLRNLGHAIAQMVVLGLKIGQNDPQNKLKWAFLGPV